jgi:CubicO group peptidase (beta-lactamase class C family)
MEADMRFRLVMAALALLCGFVIVPISAQDGESTHAGVSHERLLRIGRMLDGRIAAGDVPGTVTLVALDGRIVHLEARGMLDIDSKRPMTKDAIFSLASLTKPVTAVAILTLVEEGRVRLADPVSRFLPGFKDLKVATSPSRTVAADRPITIRDLLTHTSGLMGPAQIPTDPAATLAAFIPRFASEPLEFQPGTQWMYSNTVAFDTAARIVEVVSGTTYDRFLRERIFDPLGMKDTAHVLDAARQRRFAARYDIIPGGLRRFERKDPVGYFGGGWGLYSTAEDYFRFAQMLSNKGELEGRRVLSPRAVEMMSAVHIPDSLPGRPPGEGWGLGVRVISNNALRNTFLSNGSFGWSGASGTHFWVDPEKRLVAVFMAGAPAASLRQDFETLVMQAVVK